MLRETKIDFDDRLSSRLLRRRVLRVVPGRTDELHTDSGPLLQVIFTGEELQAGCETWPLTCDDEGEASTVSARTVDRFSAASWENAVEGVDHLSVDNLPELGLSTGRSWTTFSSRASTKSAWTSAGDGLA